MESGTESHEHIALVRSREIEHLLVRHFSAAGRGIYEKAASRSDVLPQTLIDAIRRIATMRNKVVHEINAKLPRDYESLCDKVRGDIELLANLAEVAKPLEEGQQRIVQEENAKLLSEIRDLISRAKTTDRATPAASSVVPKEQPLEPEEIAFFFSPYTWKSVQDRLNHRCPQEHELILGEGWEPIASLADLCEAVEIMGESFYRRCLSPRNKFEDWVRAYGIPKLADKLSRCKYTFDVPKTIKEHAGNRFMWP